MPGEATSHVRVAFPTATRGAAVSAVVWTLCVASLCSTAQGESQSDDLSVLNVSGRGIGGRPRYDGGGVVRFEKFAMPVQVVHYRKGRRLKLPLSIDYDVLETAPVLLTSRMGTEYWKLYHYAGESLTALYTDEKINLSKAGKHTARATQGRFGERYGPVPKQGLVAIRGHYYLLIDRLEGRDYLDIVDPPPVFDASATIRRLTFTLADLSDYSLAIGQVQSTWQPGAIIRVKIIVKDARGRELPVVNCAAVGRAGTQNVPFTTQWGPANEPTGWLIGTVPATRSDQLKVRARVVVQGPDARHEHSPSREFSWGEGRVTDAELRVALAGYELPRNDSGVLRETRAIWASTTDISRWWQRTMLRSVEAPPSYSTY